jgi:metallophosphoesterase superfamily enzyme
MRTLPIGDPHEPVCKPGYLEFCQQTYKEYDCEQPIIMGDICDSHGISFHTKSPEAPGVIAEFEQTLAGIQKWYKAFPNAIVTIGNHDERLVRLAASVNIPERFLRSYSDIWETPNWKWVYDTIIDNVYYFHGVGFSGAYPAFNAARQMGMSVVMGHTHSNAGIKWYVNPERRWFGMDVGCGIDDKKYAFDYSKHVKKRSILACGAVIDGHPYQELMPLGQYK